MRISFLLIVTIVSSLLGVAVQAQSLDRGYVRVTPNLANPSYPTHLVAIRPEGGGKRYGPGTLMIRCENNRTEAFLNVDGVYGHRGTTRARWEGMSQATRIGAGNSTTGQAAFLNNAIGFVARLVAEGSVILDVEGYNVRGAARYSLSPDLVEGIYELAKTCEWEGRLAVRVDATDDTEIDQEALRREQVKEMLPAIETMGKAEFLRLLNEMLP